MTTKNKKRCFYKNKKVFQIDNINVNKKLVSKEEPYGTKNAFKFLMGYNDNDIIRPLCVRLPQMTGYPRKFNQNTTIKYTINSQSTAFKKL